MRAGAVAGITALGVLFGHPGPVWEQVAAVQPCSAQNGTELPADAGPDPVISRLGLARAHELATGVGITVGVVDSGVDFSHPKLASAVPAPGTQIDESGVQATGQALDCVPHGTMVAGLIAAREGDEPRVYGVAPDAILYPVRFVTPIESLPRQFIAAGIRDAVDYGVGVLNLSFALPVDDPDVRAAIGYAVSKNVVVVAAAGNEGQDHPGQTWYPAAYDGVLAVAAVDQNGAPTEESNAGDWVDVAAPGVNLTTTMPTSGYGSVSGTSFATALVSGTAALVRQHHPDLSATQVSDRLTATAVRVAGPDDTRVGAGIIDPYAALTAPAGTTAPTTSTRTGQVAVAPLPGDGGLTDVARRALEWGGTLMAVAAIVAAGAAATRLTSARARAGRAADTREPDDEPPEVRLT